MINSLKIKYGKILYSDPDLGEFYSFPTLDHLKKITVDEMNQMGFGYRSSYIRGTIDFLEENKLSWLDDISVSEDPAEGLVKLPGVGRKVADCIALFSCGRLSVVPEDVHMFNFYNENIKNFTGGKYKAIASVTSKTNYYLLQSNLKSILGVYVGWVHIMFFLDRLVNKIGVKKGIKRKNSDLELKIKNKNNKKDKKK